MQATVQMVFYRLLNLYIGDLNTENYVNKLLVVLYNPIFINRVVQLPNGHSLSITEYHWINRPFNDQTDWYLNTKLVRYSDPGLYKLLEGSSF